MNDQAKQAAGHLRVAIERQDTFVDTEFNTLIFALGGQTIVVDNADHIGKLLYLITLILTQPQS